MKRFKLNLTANPTFNTVTGLTNTTFDPSDIVSGRGATEDQLKVVGDNVQIINDYLDEFGCSDCNEQYIGVRATLDALQAAQEECCDNRATQENIDALVADLRNKLNDLEAQIEECCDRNYYDDDGPSQCDGSEISVIMSWNPEQPNSGSGRIITGQMSATSSGSAPIVQYFFLAEQSAGVYLKTGTVGRADVTYTVNSTTGEITATLHQSGTAGSRIYCGARDENGCEGMGKFVMVTFS